MQGLAHGPAPDLAEMHVEDGGNVEQAFTVRDAGQVGEPDLAGRSRLEVAGQPVGRDQIAVAAVSRSGPARQGGQAPQAGPAHLPLHAGSTDPSP